MGAAKVLVILVAIIQLVSPWMGLTTASGAAALAPFLSPFTNGLCDGVDCGKGTCKTSESHLFGFICECNQGWTQFHIGDTFRFLPCNIPNCTVDYSCSKDIAPTAAPPESPPSNLSLFDPCLWSTCGGGECRKTGTFDHQCDCKAGYSNLLNISSFPCLKECSLTGDCAKLGITLSNSTSSTTTDNSSSSSTNTGKGGCPNKLYFKTILVLSWLKLKLFNVLAVTTSSTTTDNSLSSSTNSGKGGCPNKLYFKTILVLSWLKLKLFNVLAL